MASIKLCSSEKCDNKAKEFFEGKHYCGVHLRTAKSQKKKQLEKLEKEQKLKEQQEDARARSEEIRSFLKTSISKYCEDFEKLGDVNTVDINSLNEFIQEYYMDLTGETGIGVQTIKEKPTNAFESKYTGYAVAQTLYEKKKKMSKRFL